MNKFETRLYNLSTNDIDNTKSINALHEYVTRYKQLIAEYEHLHITYRKKLFIKPDIKKEQLNSYNVIINRYNKMLTYIQETINQRGITIEQYKLNRIVENKYELKENFRYIRNETIDIHKLDNNADLCAIRKLNKYKTNINIVLRIHAGRSAVQTKIISMKPGFTTKDLKNKIYNKLSINPSRLSITLKHNLDYQYLYVFDKNMNDECKFVLYPGDSANYGVVIGVFYKSGITADIQDLQCLKDEINALKKRINALEYINTTTKFKKVSSDI
jgi:hypothetical protein